MLLQLKFKKKSNSLFHLIQHKIIKYNEFFFTYIFFSIETHEDRASLFLRDCLSNSSLGSEYLIHGQFLSDRTSKGRQSRKERSIFLFFSFCSNLPRKEIYLPYSLRPLYIFFLPNLKKSQISSFFSFKEFIDHFQQSTMQNK